MDFHHDITSSGSGCTEPFFTMKVNMLQLWLILNSMRFLGKIKITKLFIKASKKIINKQLIKYFELLFPASTVFFANFDLVKACMKEALAGYRDKIFLLLLVSHSALSCIISHSFCSLTFF